MFELAAKLRLGARCPKASLAPPDDDCFCDVCLISKKKEQRPFDRCSIIFTVYRYQAFREVFVFVLQSGF